MEQSKECIEVAQANMLAAIWLFGDAIEHEPDPAVKAQLLADRKTMEQIDQRLERFRNRR